MYVPHGSLPDTRGFAPALVAYNLARNFRFTDVTTVCNREEYRDSQVVDPAIGPIYRLKEGDLYRRLFRKLTRLDPYPLHRRAATLACKLSPQLFHTHQLEFPVDDFRSRLKSPLPVIVHAHVTNRAFSPLRGSADRYIAASEYVKERLIVQGYPAERIDVIHNGVDTTLFRPPLPGEREMLRDMLGIPREAVVLTFVGRRQEIKGFHFFVRVIQELLPRFANLYVLSVGSDQRDARNEPTFAQTTRIRHELIRSFYGRYREISPLVHNKLANVYRVTDLTLQPSLTETQGMVMIESMASGCVTVASAVGGVRESISSGVTGFFVDPEKDVARMVTTVADIIKRLPDCHPISAAARGFVVERFDWQISAAKVEQLYFSLTQC